MSSIKSHPAIPEPQQSGGGDKPSKPTACTNCHSAKVRCDFNTPCERCVRLNKTCVPHVSRQGRGSKKRKNQRQQQQDGGTVASKGGKTNGNDADKADTGSGGGAGTGTTSTSSKSREAKKKKKKRTLKSQPTEDVLCKSLVSIDPQHFGIRFLIRSWISFAIRRRSFALLSRAATLATRVGISMDDVMCAKDYDGSFGSTAENGSDGTQQQQKKWHQGPVDFLYPALITPMDKQDVGDKRLLWSEIPSDLLASAGCCAKTAGLGHCEASYDTGKDGEVFDADQTTCRFAEEKVRECQNAAEMAAVVEDKSEAEILAPVLGDRWIFAREMKKGQSRYFVSPAFERDICSWESIKDAWLANEREVVSLFLPPSEKAPYIRALMHQMTLHERLGVRPRASRYGSKILVKNSNDDNDGERTLVKVDQISCMKIVSVDCSFFYNEYVPVEVSTAETLASMSMPMAAMEDIKARQNDVAPSPAAKDTPVNILSIPSSTAPVSEEDWLDLDQIGELGDLNELMDFLDEARSTFEVDMM
eukprot:CAMPEP_0178503832 /NCGR_PEP_ID=MMETSP0696-20121128/18256_1 /TAXON_ID=265572 /ORGANISM="Extubocellulus spinifer, Strain CCMP396" /LENGTH=531 /DNA_ID=CAMNT_0020132999 /DNA_START=323 /DNA_END=1918 /DNA_ORIENTATION=-